MVEIKQRSMDNPQYATLCATTGIAAINLNATTINSLLRYFDTEVCATPTSMAVSPVFSTD